MKPLELTVYPRPRYSLTTWQYQADPSKCFTDAELAAEAFREKSMMLAFRLHAEKSKGQGGKDLWTRSADEAEQRLHVLHRFATHDHYDQEDQ